MSDLNESHLAMARIVDALFCSRLKTGETPTGRQLAHAIREALKTYRNWNGLTRAVSEAFGNAPVASTLREAWCHEIAEHALNSKDIVLTVNDLLD